MKKHLLIVGVIILISFGSYYLYTHLESENNNNEVPKETVEKPSIETPIIEKRHDDNPIKLSLYKKEKDKRVKINNYTAPWNYHNDISSFEVFFTEDNELSNQNFITLFDNIYKSYNDIENYKIGYIVEFSINDEKIKQVILSPKDTEKYFSYLELYLYDDYHQTKGVWYSHITESELKEDSLLTSIKLTAGKNIDSITSEITLTAFTYDTQNSDDFDNLEYIGNSLYTIKVYKQK